MLFVNKVITTLWKLYVPSSKVNAIYTVVIVLCHLKVVKPSDRHGQKHENKLWTLKGGYVRLPLTESEHFDRLDAREFNDTELSALMKVKSDELILKI